VLAAFPANGRHFDFAQHRPPTANRRPLTANSNGLANLLTDREEEILRLMGDGLTNQEIANHLVISLYTVKRHSTNIYNKLNVTNRRQATRKAKQLDIFPSK
jgi:ATP/maltotriose-dependent transcriptional regulator MalT